MSCRPAIEAIDDLKGRDIVVLDLRGLSEATDYFVVASGTSDAHVRGIAESVLEKLRRRGVRAHHVEGLTSGRWVLLDFVDFVVHLFHPETGASTSSSDSGVMRRSSSLAPERAGVLMIRRTLVALALFAGLPSVLTAQYYFGQNKVQYRAFDFQVLRTEHFDIHFYPEARLAALDAAGWPNARISDSPGCSDMSTRSASRLSCTPPTPISSRPTRWAENPPARAPAVSPTSTSSGSSCRSPAPTRNWSTCCSMKWCTSSSMTSGAGVEPARGWRRSSTSIRRCGSSRAWRNTSPSVVSIRIPPCGCAMRPSRGRFPRSTSSKTTPRIFPYRYGQALLAFIGQRWGDEAIGAIIQGTMAGGGGLEGSIRRVLGVDYKGLSALWKEHIQKTYLPEVASQQRARDIAAAMLTEGRRRGRYTSPPPCHRMARRSRISARRTSTSLISICRCGHRQGQAAVVQVLVQQQLRDFSFHQFCRQWSPNGKYLALAAKRGPRDEILILDVARNREVRRIRVKLNGVTTPTWSPDGTQLVFTGYTGGLSDLFLINADGSNLRRLTNDRNADLHPVWSPDGKTIAFATDRGPETDFRTLHIGNMRIATYDVESGRIDLLPGMDVGHNVSPQWSPDGNEIAFTSDRTGVANIYLFDRRDQKVYQITDLFTGAQGITPLSPVLSWAHGADRLAFVYYSRDMYDVYGIDNPQSLKKEPWVAAPLLARRDSVPTGVAPRDVTVLGRDSVPTGVAPRPIPPADTLSRVTPQDSTPIETSGSLYRGSGGFRAADAAPEAGDPSQRPVTITALMDSVDIPLPDTAEFKVTKYKVSFQPDYIARPTIGYTRDNFGRGFYGGSAIALSDLLGDHQLLFAPTSMDGSPKLWSTPRMSTPTHRLNWAATVGQEPYYFLDGSQLVSDSLDNLYLITQLRRIVVRSVGGQAIYPFTRFRRVEFGLTAASISDRLQEITERLDGSGNATSHETSLPGASFIEPSVAYVFDNSLPGYVGPILWSPIPPAASQSIGGWRYFEGLADYRRYDRLIGPAHPGDQGALLRTNRA